MAITTLQSDKSNPEVSANIRRVGCASCTTINPQYTQLGLTFVEILMVLVIGSMLILAIGKVVGQALDTNDEIRERNELSQQARFAMERMVRAVSNTHRLLLPLADNPNTNWPENIREETVPPSPPIGDSTKATAVLAVTLPLYSDLDGDGVPDADDDADNQIDEDMPNNMSYSQAPGIYLIDDDGDGQIDEGGAPGDDDENNSVTGEDPMNGFDDDGDGNVDEDANKDMNADGCAGICDIDDDGDGQLDEGNTDDDDEDGVSDEDWYNPVVFYLNGDALIERMPVPWDESGDSNVTGRDYVASAIADNVTHFRVERIPLSDVRAQLVDLTLELTSPVSGESVTLQTQVRVGGTL